MSFYGLGEQTIHQGIGHFQIQNEKERDDKSSYPLEFGIPKKDLQDIKKELEKYSDDIEAIMPKLDFSGIISYEDKSTIFLAQGIDAKNENSFSSVFIKIKDGKNLGLDFDNPNKDEIIIGIKLAKYLGVKVGETITLMVSASDTSLNAIDMVVSGIFSTGIKQIDKSLIMTKISLAQELMKTDKISKLSIGLYDTSKTSQILNSMKKVLKDSPYKTYDWKELAPFYTKVVNLYTTFFRFLGSIIVFIVLVIVLGGISNIVLSRTKEIGMLKANGFSNKDVVYLILLEVFMLSLISTISAFVVSHIGIEAINNLGLMMPPPPGSSESYPLTFAHAYFDSAMMGVAIIIASLLASIIPSLKAGKLKISDALRR